MSDEISAALETHLDLPAIPKSVATDEGKEPPSKRQKLGSVNHEPIEDYSKDQNLLQAKVIIFIFFFKFPIIIICALYCMVRIKHQFPRSRKLLRMQQKDRRALLLFSGRNLNTYIVTSPANIIFFVQFLESLIYFILS